LGAEKLDRLTLLTTLEGLPARERIELVIKLLPFCLPKVDKVSALMIQPGTRLAGISAAANAETKQRPTE
jgi:hypothetical protein